MSLPRSNRLSSFAPWCATFLIALSLLGTQLTTSTSAQDSSEMSATYGRGVHAFFGNRSAEAEQLFTQVAQAGSTDPRVYYFRAMIRLQMGRQHEAEEDMRVGATFEARNPGRRHSIGLALQRIQGPGRRTLERFRREGRLDRVQQSRQQSQQRYEQLERRGPKVLRREAPMQIDLDAIPSMQPAAPVPTPAMAPAHVEVPPMAAPSEVDPFEVLEEAPVLAAPEESNLPVPAHEPTPEDDLFSDPAPQPVNTQPTPAEPTAEPESSEPADDLFGEPAASEEAADDLFGDPPADASDPPMTEEPAAEESPFEETAEPESNEPIDDLFSDPDSTETSSDDVSEDDAEEDPFGEAPADESDSTEEPAEVEDLFGNAAPKESTQNATLKEDDRVERGKLFGILGRVVGSVVPWRNIQLPAMPSSQPATVGAAETEGIALGPDTSSSEEVTPASAETPVESPDEDDLFGSGTSDSSQEEAFDSSEDDPFEGSEPAMENEPADSSEEESLELEEDLFGFNTANFSSLLNRL